MIDIRTLRIPSAFVCFVLASVATDIAVADPIGRYECNVIGAPLQDQVGDRESHALSSVQYACSGVDGLLKGAVYTSMNVSEADGPKRTLLFGGGIHRLPGGLAITQIVDGSGTVVMKDGKPAGTNASGKAVVKFASGNLRQLSGKTVTFASKPLGYNRFDLQFSD